MTTIFIPTPLRRLTAGQSKVVVNGETVSGLIKALEQSHPGIAERILDETGNPKKFINIFLNEDDIYELQGLDTLVSDRDQLSIVPALAGGA